MPKQLKHSTDVNRVAHQLVQRATGTAEEDSAPVPATISSYMAQIGAKGGRIGGKRRLKTMTAEERSSVARKAAKARWK